MEHKKKIEYPAYTREVVDSTTCDLCKNVIKEPGCYDINEVTIEHKVGHRYPGDYCGERKTLDLCPDCFELKLIPWLQSQGAEMREEDFGY